METTLLPELAEELLWRARAADTVYGVAEHHLRHTVIALVSGQELAEHNNPGGDPSRPPRAGSFEQRIGFDRGKRQRLRHHRSGAGMRWLHLRTPWSS